MTEQEAAALDVAIVQAANYQAMVVLLISDLSWMIGSLEGGGSQVPQRINDDLAKALTLVSNGGS